MKFPKLLASAIASLLDQLAREIVSSEPELAAACGVMSDALKKYAGPTDPLPPPPPHG